MKSYPTTSEHAKLAAPKPKPKFSYGAHVAANFGKHPKAMKILK